MKIKWKNPSYYKNVSAEKVYTEITELGSKNKDETVTLQAIVDKARDEKSELHKCFEWNDTIAAEKYRQQQARVIMINLVKVQEFDDNKERVIRTHVNIQRGTHEYKPIEYVVKHKDEYTMLLERAKKELIAFKNKYSQLSELTELMKILEEYI